MIAFLPTLGFQEMAVLLALGVILFGRNLPDVGRTLGRTFAQLRRGMQDFKDQIDRDENVRQLRDSVRETKQEIARATALPRAIADPHTALGNIARESLAPTDGAATAGASPPAAPPAAAATSEPKPASADATDGGLAPWARRPAASDGAANVPPPDAPKPD